MMSRGESTIISQNTSVKSSRAGSNLKLIKQQSSIPTSPLGDIMKKKSNAITSDPHLKPLVLMDKTIESRQNTKVWSPKYVKP
jgi:hypothetical protein